MTMLGLILLLSLAKQSFAYDFPECFHEHDFLCPNNRCIPKSWLSEDDIDDICGIEDKSRTEALFQQYQFGKYCKEDRIPCGKTDQLKCRFPFEKDQTEKTEVDFCVKKKGGTTYECKDEEPACGYARIINGCSAPGSLQCFDDQNKEVCKWGSQICDNKRSCDSNGNVKEKTDACGKFDYTIKDSFDFETSLMLEPKGTVEFSHCTFRGKQRDNSVKFKADESRWNQLPWNSDPDKRQPHALKFGSYVCQEIEKRKPSDDIGRYSAMMVKIRYHLCSPKQSWQCQVGDVCVIMIEKDKEKTACLPQFDHSLCGITAHSYEFALATEDNMPGHICHEANLTACDVLAAGGKLPPFRSDSRKTCSLIAWHMLSVQGLSSPLEMYGLSAVDLNAGWKGTLSTSLHRSGGRFVQSRVHYFSIDKMENLEKKTCPNREVCLEDLKSDKPMYARAEIKLTDENLILFHDFLVFDSTKINVTGSMVLDTDDGNCTDLSTVVCSAQNVVSNLKGIDGIEIVTYVKQIGSESIGTREKMIAVPGTHNYTCTVVVKYRLMNIKVREIDLKINTTNQSITCTTAAEVERLSNLARLEAILFDIEEVVNSSRIQDIVSGTENTDDQEDVEKKSKTGIILSAIALVVVLIAIGIAVFAVFLVFRQRKQLEDLVEEMDERDKRDKKKRKKKEKGSAAVLKKDKDKLKKDKDKNKESKKAKGQSKPKKKKPGFSSSKKPVSGVSEELRKQKKKQEGKKDKKRSIDSDTSSTEESMPTTLAQIVAKSKKGAFPHGSREFQQGSQPTSLRSLSETQNKKPKKPPHPESTYTFEDDSEFPYDYYSDEDETQFDGNAYGQQNPQNPKLNKVLDDIY